MLLLNQEGFFSIELSHIEWLREDICQTYSTVISNMGILPTPPFSEIDDRKVGVLSIPILSKTDELISGILPLPPSENLEFPKTVLIPDRINFENQLKKSITQIEKSLDRVEIFISDLPSKVNMNIQNFPSSKYRSSSQKDSDKPSQNPTHSMDSNSTEDLETSQSYLPGMENHSPNNKVVPPPSGPNPDPGAVPPPGGPNPDPGAVPPPGGLQDNVYPLPPETDLQEGMGLTAPDTTGRERSSDRGSLNNPNPQERGVLELPAFPPASSNNPQERGVLELPAFPPASSNNSQEPGVLSPSRIDRAGSRRPSTQPSIANLELSCDDENRLTATLKNQKDSMPVILWTPDSPEDAKERCEEISDRFDRYNKSGYLDNLAAGKLSSKSAIGVSSKANGKLGEGVETEEGLLFELKSESETQKALTELQEKLNKLKELDRSEDRPSDTKASPSPAATPKVEQPTKPE
ncbi:MAG: COP23 domain-containing protein [Geitlerinemataceae cyanobacterium]